MIILFSLFIQFVGAETNLPTVSIDGFDVGKTWIWAYSERTKDKQGWQEPHLYEQYKVIEVKGNVVTIEMSSSSTLPVKTNAHHKFVVDVDDCLRQQADYNYKKDFSLQFYTKSLGPHWEKAYSPKGIVFTEKFNCVSMAPEEKINLGHAIFQFKNSKNKTWYITIGDFAGVAFEKEFDQNYRFQLIVL